MRRVDMIIVHCSATPEGKDFTVKDIDRWHRERGFDRIGYHYVVYRDGSIHAGRPEEMVGAHCHGKNAHSIGICYIGGLSSDGKTAKDTRTDEQKRGLKEIVARMVKRYPWATVHGHNEFAAKACPCFDVKRWAAEAGFKTR